MKMKTDEQYIAKQIMSLEDEKNPFQIPQNNTDIIRLREEEKLKKAQAREINRKLKIWQKGKNMGQSPSILSKRNYKSSTRKQMLFDDDSKLSEKEHNDNNNSSSSSSSKTHEWKNLSSTQKDYEETLEACAPYRIEEKSDMNSFIAKKREMFLLQMSLNIKREEIQKVEERARLKEEALKRSEEMLEEDGIRFDAFLKENDKKAQDAIRKAELETKKKMDKVQEIKKVNHATQTIQSDISKHTEVLEECSKYKEFLDQLTPPEWMEEQKIIKSNRQKKRRTKRIQARKEKWRNDQEEKMAEAKAKAETEAKTGMTSEKRKKRELKNNKTKQTDFEYTLPPEPDFEDEEPLTSSGDELPMYFERPQQLLDIFTGLEEENLFLIQNKQESEQTLKELKQKYTHTEKQMLEKVDFLEQNVNEFKQSIQNEETKIAMYMQRIQNNIDANSNSNNNSNTTPSNKNNNSKLDGNNSKNANDHTDMFVKLGEKVKEVYSRCGFDDSGTTPTTLFMISELEARMEELLVEINELPEKFVRKEIKEKEKRRREVKRMLKLEAQQKAQEERNRKALERSMQPPKKRTTKPIMFRSQPFKQKVREEKKEVTEEELDEIKYLT